MRADEALLLLGSSHVTPVPRAPLPAWDPDTTDPESGAPLPVHKTITGTIPPPWTPDYLRSNLWGMYLPYLPPIDGGGVGPSQFRLLTYLLYAYPRALWPRILADYARASYEVFWLSIPDARTRGGMDVAAYLDLARTVAASGLRVGHFLRSKDWDAPDTDPTLIEPYVDALEAQGLIAWGSPAWEASLFNTPAAYRAQIHHDAQRWPRVKWGVHLQAGYADFGPDGEGHGPAFWNDCLSVGVRRLFYQYKSDVTYPNRPGCVGWSGGMMQARGNDVSTRLVAGGLWGLPETVDWFVFEQTGVNTFNNLPDGDGRTPDEGVTDLKGLEGLCTPGPLAPRGFGNGARYPDGRNI